jgi:hypothetical protein
MITPTTLEVAPVAKGFATKAKLPLRENACGHLTSFEAYYPAFDLGFSEPFALLFAVCKVCASKATAETVLTDEAWKRMQMILIGHDIPVPDRKSLKLQMLLAIPPKPQTAYHDEAANWYSYALVA